MNYYNKIKIEDKNNKGNIYNYIESKVILIKILSLISDKKLMFWKSIYKKHVYKSKN